MRVVTDQYQHGDVICQHVFADEAASLLEVLEALEPALYEIGEFSDIGRPLKPKRQEATIQGEAKPLLMPVNQKGMNRAIKKALRDDGWASEPVASGPMAGPSAPLALRGDFVRNRVFVEVEFGNVASLDRDFFKFQIANRSGAGDVGVIVVATDRLARFFDQNVATFEAACRRRPYLAIGVQMPVWIVGIEPADFDVAIRPHYDAMWELCSTHGVECHTFAEALGPETVVRQADSDNQPVNED